MDKSLFFLSDHETMQIHLFLTLQLLQNNVHDFLTPGVTRLPEGLIHLKKPQLKCVKI